jgi:DNA-binding XRE family transcriptional regulator
MNDLKTLRNLSGMSAADLARTIQKTPLSIYNAENAWPFGSLATTVPALAAMGFGTLFTAAGTVAAPAGLVGLPGRSLQRLRKAKGYSRADLAKRLKWKKADGGKAIKRIELAWPHLSTVAVKNMPKICEVLGIEVYYSANGQAVTLPAGTVGAITPVADLHTRPVRILQALVLRNTTQRGLAESSGLYQSEISRLCSDRPRRSDSCYAGLVKTMAENLDAAILIGGRTVTALLDTSKLPNERTFSRSLIEITIPVTDATGRQVGTRYIHAFNPQLKTIRAACVEHDVTAVFLPSGKWGFVDNMAL